MRKISLFTSSFSRNGVARNRITLAHAFLQLGYQVEFVVSHHRGEIACEVPAQCPVHELGTLRPRQMITRLGRYLRERKPDGMIAASWPNTGAAIIAKALFRPSMRLVVSEHSDFRCAADFAPRDRWILEKLGALLYRGASQVVTVAEGTRDGLAATTGFPADRVKVIYNPLRPMETTPPVPGELCDPELESWWMSGGRRLLAVGRLEVAKDYATLISALALVPRELDARLVILGEGGLRAELEQHAQRLGVAGLVQIAGFRSNVADFYKRADVFVLSSINEGFANVILEALSFGLPVVSTDCMSGPGEILGHGRWGRLAPVGSAEHIARHVIEALSEPPQRAQLVERSRAFLPTAIARQYAEALFPAAPFPPAPTSIEQAS